MSETLWNVPFGVPAVALPRWKPTTLGWREATTMSGMPSPVASASAMQRAPPYVGIETGAANVPPPALPFPGSPDRTCDTVADLAEAADTGPRWAVVTEFQTEPEPEMLDRLLEYLGRLRRGLRGRARPLARRRSSPTR